MVESDPTIPKISLSKQLTIGDIQLPADARLKLQVVEKTLQPLEFLTVRWNRGRHPLRCKIKSANEGSKMVHCARVD